jgi:GxxExxY protein
MHEINRITGHIVDTAYRVHSALGPGLMESVYEAVMQQRLLREGFAVERQKKVTFQFEGIHFDEGLKVDLLVDGRVIVELKSVEKFAPIHSKQLLTYLRLMDLPVGILINFGGESMKDGIRRVANARATSAGDVLFARDSRLLLDEDVLLRDRQESHAESSESAETALLFSDDSADSA